MRLHVVVNGGLGNQLSALAAGYVVARSHGKDIQLHFQSASRPVIAGSRADDLRAFDLGVQYLPGVQVVTPKDRPAIFGTIARRIVARLHPVALRGNMPFVKGSCPTGVDILCHLLAGNDLAICGNYESREVVLEAIRLGMARGLQLRSPSNTFYRNTERQIDSKILGVHIRLSDFRTWEDGSWLLPPQYYQESVEDLLPSFDQVWVFSDEPQVAAQYFSDRRRISVLTGTGMSNAEELKLLSQCAGIVGSKSSFSWWASLWSPPTTRVISPHSHGWRLPSWSLPVRNDSYIR